jgi:hypothetical protein
MATSASGSHTKTQGIVEVTWGVTPATPTMLQFPIESNTLQLTKTTLTDNTLRSDRNGGDVRPGAKKLAGDLKFNHRRGDFDLLLANLFQAAWVVNVLKNGKTASSMSIETGYTDIAQYSTITGLQVDSFSLSVKPNSLISATMSFIGKSQTALAGVSAATISTAPTTNEPFDSFTGSMKEGGSTIATVTGIDISIKNNLVGTEVLFDDTIAGITAGNCLIDGTITAQFLDASLYNKFVNNTSTSLEFTLTDVATKSHTFSFPKIVYTAGDISPTGPDSLAISLKFNAQYDSVSASKVTLTRTV